MLLTRKQWLDRAQEFVRMRLGLWEATDREFLAGYVDGFKAVYAIPERVEGEPWYVWFIFPGKGKAARIVNEIMPGVFCDHEGNVYEHDPAWTIVLGTVTRIGQEPLLSIEMFS